MEQVYILGGLRSHLGLKNSIFKNIPPEQLGAALLRQLCVRWPEVKEADLLVCGNAVGSGGNLGRLMSLLAGLPEAMPAVTVDMQCASAAEAIDIGYAKIRSGLTDVVICGGVESCSMQPLRTYRPWDERYTPEGYYTAQFSPDSNSPRVMLEGAERTAQVYGVSRQELDEWAVGSHKKAWEAVREHLLDPYVVSLFGSTKDESIRKSMSPRLAGRMPTLFTPEETEALLTEQEQKDVGSVTPTLTAANACMTQDGAAFLVLVSGSRLAAWRQAGRTEVPLGRILEAAESGVDPRFSPLGALAVGDKLLKRSGLTADEIDVFEYNEAFAVISTLFARNYPELSERYLPLGGALAYGHPYGCSGAVLVLHALAGLTARQGKLGLCAIAGAGGTGAGLILERITEKRET